MRPNSVFTFSIPGYISENLKQIPKEKDIILYCASGERSSISASILKANGFSKVYNYSPGIIGWKKAKQELVKPQRVLD